MKIKVKSGKYCMDLNLKNENLSNCKTIDTYPFEIITHNNNQTWQKYNKKRVLLLNCVLFYVFLKF